jgi:hypothetical protein
MIESAMKAGQDKNLGHEYNKDIETRYREEHRISIQLLGTNLTLYFKGVSEMEILVLYLVIQEVVNLGR